MTDPQGSGTGGPADRSVPETPDAAFDRTVCVLMAGGFGTRFWPLSTPDRPKQFLTELTDRSLYTQAADRAAALVGWDRILVMTNRNFVDLVREQTPKVPAGNVICEPLRRDTAAAIILAALFVEHRWPGHRMIVTPSDHLVADLDEYRRTMAAAARRARDGGLGTVGVPPTFPATGFGYLRLAEKPAPAEPQPVEAFVEKPDRAAAREYVESGRYLWNAGMFVWGAETLLAAAREHLPEMTRHLEALSDAFDRDRFPEAALEAFRKIEPISIDYGIMEKADGVWVVPATFPWSDLGGWLAAEEILPADAKGNRVIGCVELDEASDSIVIGPPDHPVLVAGLADCIVVHTESGTLVCHKSAAERIKPLVQRVLGGTKGSSTS